MQHFYFIYDAFGIPASVASAEHSYGAAEVTPLHAASACDEREDGFSHSMKRVNGQEVICWAG
jgi:hypothetical protein